jgi:hypothetical protein
MPRVRRLARSDNLLRFRSCLGGSLTGRRSVSAVILRCTVCGSGAVELRGPVGDDNVVRCAACGAEVGYWPEFLWRVERHISQWRRALMPPSPRAALRRRK